MTDRRTALPAILLAMATAPALAAEAASQPAASTGMSDLMFYVFGGLAAICCLGVVFSANIVRSTIWLLGILGSVACVYFLLEANFLGAIQLIVYAGGILVLIIFGIMLTSKSPYVKWAPRPVEAAVATTVCLLLFALLVWVTGSVAWHETTEASTGGPDVAELGKSLLTTYLVPFEVVSVLLLTVMIGAAYLVRSER